MVAPRSPQDCFSGGYNQRQGAKAAHEAHEGDTKDTKKIPQGFGMIRRQGFRAPPRGRARRQMKFTEGSRSICGDSYNPPGTTKQLSNLSWRAAWLRLGPRKVVSPVDTTKGKRQKRQEAKAAHEAHEGDTKDTKKIPQKFGMIRRQGFRAPPRGRARRQMKFTEGSRSICGDSYNPPGTTKLLLNLWWRAAWLRLGPRKVVSPVDTTKGKGQKQHPSREGRGVCLTEGGR